MIKPIVGFSKLSKEQKIDWIANTYTQDPENTIAILKKYWHTEAKTQKLHDEFIENTISNYFLPLGIAPNFLINGKYYAIPMAIEESSVVAAASKAAKFWAAKGGFKTEVIASEKIGQVHFIYNGDTDKLKTFFKAIKPQFFKDTQDITQSMEKRGGGILDIVLKDKTQELAGYYQLHATFETLDAMGANFINSCLEQFAKTLCLQAKIHTDFTPEEKQIEVLMSILSNYVPNCLVRASVRCDVADLATPEYNGLDYAKRFVRALRIATIEPYRAVTHNKGIMNGIDAVVLATGNDFRAVEAGVHAYAARDGKYRSLTHASIDNGIFTFSIEVPLALGTVGGLTKLHPLVKTALEILQNPSAKELMQITAVAGLAQNFAAVNSLITTGIQKGHMKMHLLNILNQLGATNSQKQTMVAYYKDKTITHSGVLEAFEKLQNNTLVL